MLESVFLEISLIINALALWVFAFSRLLKKESFIPIFNKFTFGFIFFSLALSLALRGFRLERFPISNLYETLILLACLLAGNYLFFIFKYKWHFLSWLVNIIVLAILFYALWLPSAQKDGLPLVPALQSYWRIIHVPALLASYAFFCLAAFGGLFYLLEDWKNKNKNKLEFYSEIIYRCISFGFPLLTFGIVTGALWANHAWGNLWQWDPKENLALVTWFCYATYLHLKISGKGSSKVLALISLIGIMATYLTYIGINQFNIGGLHTYGQTE